MDTAFSSLNLRLALPHHFRYWSMNAISSFPLALCIDRTGGDKCGMGQITAKPRETVAHVIALSVLALNLRKIQCAFLCLLTYLLAVFPPKQKRAIVQ